MQCLAQPFPILGTPSCNLRCWPSSTVSCDHSAASRQTVLKMGLTMPEISGHLCWQYHESAFPQVTLPSLVCTAARGAPWP